MKKIGRFSFILVLTLFLGAGLMIGCAIDDGGGDTPQSPVDDEGSGGGKWGTITDIVNVPGSPNGIVVDSQGNFAYLTNKYALLVLDLATRQLTKNYALTLDIGSDLNGIVVDNINKTDSLVALHAFGGAAIADVEDGSQVELISASAIYGAAFAQGFLYAPSFNDRVVYAASIDGSTQQTINPYPEGGKIAGPCSIVSTPDGSTVLFGDEFNNAVHAIDTSTNTVIATYVIGFKPKHIVPIDENNAVIVHEDDGTVAFIDLTNPAGVPKLVSIDSLEGVEDLVIDPARTSLFVLHRKKIEYEGDNYGLYQPEVVVLDLSIKTVSSRILIDDDKPASWPDYDLAITPDGSTLLVAGEEAIYFLE